MVKADKSSTELLIVKEGDNYIRFLQDGFERCSMNKGSVYPLAQLQEVKERCQNIADQTGPLKLMKLTITEEPFVE